MDVNAVGLLQGSWSERVVEHTAAKTVSRSDLSIIKSTRCLCILVDCMLIGRWVTDFDGWGWSTILGRFESRLVEGFVSAARKKPPAVLRLGQLGRTWEESSRQSYCA